MWNIAACTTMIVVAGLSTFIVGGTTPAWPDPQKPQSTLSQPADERVPVVEKAPPLIAEGANACEIVSCGMGIKETCKITCPPDKTPKCSCDCIRNIGPMCMESEVPLRVNEPSVRAVVDAFAPLFAIILS
jgi:hypothetical protein